MPKLIRSVFSRRPYFQHRRQTPRLRIRLVFTVSPCRKSHGAGLRPERTLRGHTRDLSAGGLALNLPQMHLDGHYLAAEGREVKVNLELPTGSISMHVVPRHHERLEHAELGCKFLVGVQITEISDEDRKRYLSFVTPENLRSSKPSNKQIAPDGGRSLPPVQADPPAKDPQSLPIVQTEIAPEMEISSAPIEQVSESEGTTWATQHVGAWRPTYQITELSCEDKKRCLSVIAPEFARTFPSKELVPEDGRSLPAVKKETAPDLEVSYAPIEQATARRRLTWKPIYAAGIVVIGITLVIGGALQLKRRTQNIQTKETNAGTDLAPQNRIVNDLSMVGPEESSVDNSGSSAAIIALNDRAGMISLDTGGNVSGLDDVPAPTREDIANALLSERIARPAILKYLAGQENAVGGSEEAQSFKLISPARAVIVSDRPTLKWERVSGANSYRVYVSDSAGQEIAKSDALPSERSEWLLPTQLKRGEIYRWSVVAVVNDKEIASPRMKFQVLSERNLQQLTQLKKTGSNLALGVFFSREGMVLGAEREFQALLRKNPESVIAKKLLVGVQSWQKPPAPNSGSAKDQSAPRVRGRETTVQVIYDENGRVTQAWGTDAAALRIARQKRFPAGKAGSATIRIPLN